MMKYSLLTGILFGINVLGASAQSFKWTADLEHVSADGFYKIALTPKIISKTVNLNLADIRIYERDKEIAYLLRRLPDSLYLKDTTSLTLEHYTAVPAPTLVVREDKINKRSIVSINFNANYQIDKLRLNLEGFRYYRRTAWLSDTDPLADQKKNRYNEHKLVNIIISSEKKPVLDLYLKNREKQLFLIIENEDNAPLLIKNIEAYQKNIELITYLEKDKQYIFKTGRLKTELPRYDLSYFSDSIGNEIAALGVLNFKNTEKETLKKESFFVDKGWMWAAIGLLIVFLGYLSYFMVREMQQKKEVH